MLEEKLAKNLMKFQNCRGVVLAVPRGAVPIAYIVAKELSLPLNLLLTKKIGLDAVDDVIEMVLNKKGNVVFVENGMLKDHQHISLITRY